MSSPETSLSIAVDIGGTFTDISLLDRATGQVWRAKTPSVPDDPSEAFMTGIRLALADAGAPATALDQVLHGTTVATNMILEGKGAASALVTTRGFRHVLAIGRQDIPRKANLYTWVKPERPVPASRIVEIDERLAAGGSVLRAARRGQCAQGCRSHPPDGCRGRRDLSHARLREPGRMSVARPRSCAANFRALR